MAHTKSQLPMLRSLKAIARRKMNQSTYNIEIPAAVKKQIEANRKQELADGLKIVRARVRALTKAELATFVLHHAASHLAPSSEHAQVRKLEQDLTRDLPDRYVHHPEHTWWREQIKDQKKLFIELEAIELQIIAGEHVDLAPYARRLQS